jgi:K+-sensing histidine kinase KdpD
MVRDLTGTSTLPAVLDELVHRLTRHIPRAQTAVVWLWDSAQAVLVPHAVAGEAVRDPEALKGIHLRPGEWIAGAVHADQSPRMISDTNQMEAAHRTLSPENEQGFFAAIGRDVAARSALAIPLRSRGQGYGALVLISFGSSDPFSKEDIALAEVVADGIALAVDRSRLEQEASAVLESKDAHRLRAEIMATLSHELRTPLAAIKGYSTAMLLEEIAWSDAQRRDFLKLIDEECDNLQSMIAQILDSSLIDVGQLSLEVEPLRLERLARDVAEEIQRRTGDHRIMMDFPSGFPIVDADPRRVKQVLRNILDNAVKYSPDGGLVVIRGEVRPEVVVVTISDEGVGISPEDLIPLFDKYFRVKAPTGYHVPGTGLGLPVARTLVEAHGGRIWARSAVGQGTTLSFSLPRPGPDASPLGEERHEADG